MTLIDEVLLPHGLESPPFGLDIIILICYVRMLHIGPETDTVGHVLPLILVCPYGFLTLLDEGLDSVFLDLGLAVDTERFLNFELDRETVGIPTCLKGDRFTFH